MISKEKLIDIIVYSSAAIATAVGIFVYSIKDLDKSLREIPRFEYLEFDMNKDGFIDRMTLTNTQLISRIYNPQTGEFVFSETYSTFDNKLSR